LVGNTLRFKFLNHGFDFVTKLWFKTFKYLGVLSNFPKNKYGFDQVLPTNKEFLKKN
jgi:hypothetical protein